MCKHGMMPAFVIYLLTPQALSRTFGTIIKEKRRQDEQH
jgi:hypothetical protein